MTNKHIAHSTIRIGAGDGAGKTPGEAHFLRIDGEYRTTDAAARLVAEGLRAGTLKALEPILASHQDDVEDLLKAGNIIVLHGETELAPTGRPCDRDVHVTCLKIGDDGNVERYRDFHDRTWSSNHLVFGFKSNEVP